MKFISLHALGLVVLISAGGCSSYEYGGPIGNTHYMTKEAAAYGVPDYSGTVAGALLGDPESMSQIMRLTPHVDNEAFVEQARVLYKMLERVGDQKFSRVFEGESSKVRESVADAIMRHIYFLKPGVTTTTIDSVFESEFPLTYNAI